MQPPQVMLGHFNQEATCYCWRSNNAELVIWRIRRKLRKKSLLIGLLFDVLTKVYDTTFEPKRLDEVCFE